MQILFHGYIIGSNHLKWNLSDNEPNFDFKHLQIFIIDKSNKKRPTKFVF